MLKFSGQLQMQPFTKLHAHFPSHPLYKSPSHSPPHSSKTTLLHYIRRTSFATQYQKSQEKYDEAASLPNSSSADLLPPLHYNFWSVFITCCSTFRSHHTFWSVFTACCSTFRSHHNFWSVFTPSASTFSSFSSFRSFRHSFRFPRHHCNSEKGP